MISFVGPQRVAFGLFATSNRCASHRRRGAALVALGLATLSLPASAVDEEAARALATKSKCFNCHSVETKKDGPAYKAVAKKYRGKADAEEKLFTHITTAPTVKVDGEEQDHQIVKSKDKPAILNLVRWILSL